MRSQKIKNHFLSSISSQTLGKLLAGVKAINGSLTTEEAIKVLGPSPVAVRAALRRLRQKGELDMPHKGF